MVFVNILLLVLSFICLLCAAVSLTPPHPRIQFGWLGMLFWLASTIKW